VSRASTRGLLLALNIACSFCQAFFYSLPFKRLVSLRSFIHSFTRQVTLASNFSNLQSFSREPFKMRSDLFALTAAVAGCAVAAPAAQPQWGSWGSGGGWGSNGGWGGWGGNAPPAAGSPAAGGIPAPTDVSPPVASPPFPTGTGAPFPTGTGAPLPSGTGVMPIGTGTTPVRAMSTGVSSAEVPISTGVSSEAPATNSSSSAGGLTGESTDANGLNALFVAKGKQYYGTCADPGTLSSAETADIIKADFGQITPENRYESEKSGETRERLPGC
jgi:hypothetical protein